MAIVSDEQVIKVLRQYNPWWRNPSAIKEERGCREIDSPKQGKM